MFLSQHCCMCLQLLLTSVGEAGSLGAALPHHQAVTCRGMEIRGKAQASS